MLTLSAQAIAEKNALGDAGAWVELYELTLAGEASPVLRLTPNNEAVVFAAETYSPWPMQREPLEEHAKGGEPTVRVRVCNFTGSPGAYLADTDGIVGGNVRIMLVHSEHLDLATAEVTLDFEVLSASVDTAWVTLELGAATPASRRCPRARLLKNHCRWKFKSTECGYAGATASCNKTLSACRAMAGGSNSARFGGFPGVGRGGLSA